MIERIWIEESVSLKTKVHIFIEWIKATLPDRLLTCFPKDAHGYWILRPIELPSENMKFPIRGINIDAIYHTGTPEYIISAETDVLDVVEQAITLSDEPEFAAGVLLFQFLNLEDERIELTLICTIEVFHPCFNELLSRIKKLWPEIEKQHGSTSQSNSKQPVTNIRLGKDERPARNIRLDTLVKLEKLRKLRADSIRDGYVTLSFTKACENAQITTKTVISNAPNLRANWDNVEYSED